MRFLILRECLRFWCVTLLLLLLLPFSFYCFTYCIGLDVLDELHHTLRSALIFFFSSLLFLYFWKIKICFFSSFNFLNKNKGKETLHTLSLSLFPLCRLFIQTKKTLNSNSLRVSSVDFSCILSLSLYTSAIYPQKILFQ